MFEEKKCPEKVRLVIGKNRNLISLVTEERKTYVAGKLTYCDEAVKHTIPLFVVYLPGTDSYRWLNQKSYNCKGEARVGREKILFDVFLNQPLEKKMSPNIPVYITYYDEKQKVERPLFWPHTNCCDVLFSGWENLDADIWQKRSVFKEMTINVQQRED